MSKKFIGVVSLFPDAFTALTGYGVVGRALAATQVQLAFFNPRDYATDKYQSVDETPYGGGPGMLLKYATLAAALDAAIVAGEEAGAGKPQVIYLSPQGRQFTQLQARTYAEQNSLVLLCGCYEGLDERIIAAYVEHELSIGDYILSGGELAAMVFLNVVARLWHATLGNEVSREEESFSQELLEGPQYTRPAEGLIAGMRARPQSSLTVPLELTSGNHQAISDYNYGQALARTWLRRPELLAKRQLLIKEKRLLLKHL